MKAYKLLSNSEEETIQFAQRIAKLLRPGDIICLIGDLGAGKTTFVKGLAEGLKAKQKDVSSPTFVLMNLYEGKMPIFHFDLYRLDGEESIKELGYDEFLYGDGVSVIEWAERLGTLTPKEYLEIQLHHKTETQRDIRVKAHGIRYKQIVEKL